MFGGKITVLPAGNTDPVTICEDMRLGFSELDVFDTDWITSLGLVTLLLVVVVKEVVGEE